MSELETWKWLWSQSYFNYSRQEEIVDVVCERGDSEALKWLWLVNLLSSSRQSKIIDAVCERGDPETLKWFWNHTLFIPSYQSRLSSAMLDRTKTPRGSSRAKAGVNYMYDVFICHASEDKASFVAALASNLKSHGVSVWYDDFTLELGDSLLRKIDEGLAHSRYGIVVLSKVFFAKNWPQHELDGLFSREVAGAKVILPIWHGVSFQDVRAYSPILAGKLAVSTSKGIGIVVSEILKVLRNKINNH